MVKDKSELATHKIVRDERGNETVTEVAKASPAQAAGIRVGDRVELSVVGVGSVLHELPMERLDAEIGAIDPRIRQYRFRGPTASRASTGRRLTAAEAARPARATYTTTRKDRPRREPHARDRIGNGSSGSPGRLLRVASIAGDRRLLGWHINRVNAADPLGLVPLASEFPPDVAGLRANCTEPAVTRPAAPDRRRGLAALGGRPGSRRGRTAAHDSNC